MLRPIRLAAGFLVSGIMIMGITSCAEPGIAGEQAGDYFSKPLDLALANAAASGDVAGMEVAVAGGADVDARGADGITMFFWVYSAKNKAGFKKLHELGADPLLEAKEGRTVAFFAARDEDPGYLEMLLEGGLDPDAVDPGSSGETLLMEAAGRGLWPQVELLLRHCADLNRADDFGRTAAISAVTGLNLDMVVRFLEEGYSYNLREGLGRTLDIIRLNESSPQYQSERKAIALLEARGVVFPVDDGEPAPKAPPPAEPVYAESCEKR